MDLPRITGRRPSRPGLDARYPHPARDGVETLRRVQRRRDDTPRACPTATATCGRCDRYGASERGVRASDSVAWRRQRMVRPSGERCTVDAVVPAGDPRWYGRVPARRYSAQPAAVRGGPVRSWHAATVRGDARLCTVEVLPERDVPASVLPEARRQPLRLPANCGATVLLPVMRQRAEPAGLPASSQRTNSLRCLTKYGFARVPGWLTRRANTVRPATTNRSALPRFGRITWGRVPEDTYWA